MVARLWYGLSVPLCVFDLDHTLIQTPLDLAAMALDMRALIEQANGPMPTRPERYRVGELIAHCQRSARELEAAVWEVALDHERRAMEVAVLEPGALAAIVGARRRGFATAIWTNNARELTVPALARLGLADELDLVVTRDDMRALKPDPDGWRVISEHFGKRPDGAGTRDRIRRSGRSGSEDLGLRGRELLVGQGAAGVQLPKLFELVVIDALARRRRRWPRRRRVVSAALGLVVALFVALVVSLVTASVLARCVGCPADY